MKRLLQIGFEQVGNWRLRERQLSLELFRMNGQRNVLYAFVQDAAVLYVGKTTGSLEGRMGGYLRPSTSQRTNVRNHQALLQLLLQGLEVEIYAWADPGMHRIGEFHLNYAAGLEDSIIRTVAPPWNGAKTTGAEAAGKPTTEPEVAASLAGAPAPVQEGESASANELRDMEHAGLIKASPTFDVILGDTYYHRGFFNVPIKYSELFPAHGTGISVYCGDARTLIRATVDRRANQANHTPRIYGRGSLANWFGIYKNLDDVATIRVVSVNEIELT